MVSFSHECIMIGTDRRLNTSTSQATKAQCSEYYIQMTVPDTYVNTEHTAWCKLLVKHEPFVNLHACPSILVMCCYIPAVLTQFHPLLNRQRRHCVPRADCHWSFRLETGRPFYGTKPTHAVAQNFLPLMFILLRSS